MKNQFSPNKPSKFFKVLNLVFFHGSNYIKKFLYLKTGYKFLLPKPSNIYFIPTARCNSRCNMCYSWKVKKDPISLDVWKKTIDQLVEWVGPWAKINISGGEMLLTEYSREIIFYCASKSKMAGITSNGYLIDEKMAQKLVAHNFSNINISLDGVKKKTAELIRGRRDSLKLTSRAVQLLVKEKKKQGSDVKIIIKTIIMGLNVLELPSLVTWGQKIEVDGIYLQPIEPIFHSDQSFKELKKTDLWISRENLDEACRVFDKLINMKKRGYGILNSVEEIEGWKSYFGKKDCVSASSDKNLGCNIDLQTLFFGYQGNVKFCPNFPEIGNVEDGDLEDTVFSKKALIQREAIRKCKKNCSLTCTSDKKLPQLFRLFKFLIR